MASIEPSYTPRPTWAEFVPPVFGPSADPPYSVCCSWSLTVRREALSPTVLTLARLLETTSSIVWCVCRPEMAEYMPRIILEAPDGSSGFPNWGPAGGVGWRPAASSTLSRVLRLGDDGAVDVREHVVLHLIAPDGRDDRPVGDRDHE